MLALFNTATKYEKGIRTVMAAVNYKTLEFREIRSPPEITSSEFFNKNIENGLKSVHHYHNIQLQDNEIGTITLCVEVLSELVNSVYAMIEAISSIRARFRYLQYTSTNETDMDSSLERYEDLMGKLGVEDISPSSLSPLVAFLTSGVKGLLINSKDSHKYGQIKLAHFLMLTHKLQQKDTIKEDVWQTLQALILHVIEGALFPQGFEKAAANPEMALDDDKWKHKECSMSQIAKAMRMDLARFCSNRSQFLDGDTIYEDPPFEMPDCQSASATKKSKNKVQTS